MKDKLEKLIQSKKFTLFVSFLGLYLLSTGGSWALFTYLQGDPNLGGMIAKDTRLRVDPNLPKTESCPINGKMYSKPERDIWEERRPVAAMIENHLDARPLSGISRADVVYEAVAEGGITRFLGIFYCGASAQDMEVAVIRSARVYYINWALEYGDKPIYLHWGGANNICSNCPGGVKTRGTIDPRVDAYSLLNKIGWYGGTAGNDFNAGHNIGVPAVMRVKDRLEKGYDAADEHQPVAFLDEIFNEAKKRGLGYKDSEGVAWDEDFIKWTFKDGKPVSNPSTAKISFSFWDDKPDYDVVWEYDGTNNIYKRFNGGQPFTDWYFDKEQVTASNVVIQFVKEEGEVDKEGHMFYTTVGTGKAIIFQNGEVIEGEWVKKTQFDRTRFFDSDGSEVEFVRGSIWIEALPSSNEVEY